MQDDLVFLVTNIPNPYRIALFNRLSKQFKEAGYRLQVIFGASTYSRRKYQLNLSELQFENHLLKSTTLHFGNNEHTYFFYQGLCRYILKNKPRVIIVGGFNLATFKIALLRFFLPVRMIIWSGSIVKSGRNDSWLRKIYRKWLVQRCCAFVVYGTLSGQYLKSLGANPSDIFTAINTVDTQFFKEETMKLRSGYEKKPPFHFCTVGYFSKRKNGTAILKAIKKLKEQRQDFVLDIIGDGNDLDSMKDFVKQNNLQDHVHFYGYRQQHELPGFFARSVAFLFQTGFDIWGLVLNEAMAAGVVCLSSVNAGATHDLIEHGINGFSVNFDDEDQVAGYLHYLLEHPDKAEEMGRRASETIQQIAHPDLSAKGFINATRNCSKP